MKSILRNVTVFIIAALAFYAGLTGGKYIQTNYRPFLRDSLGEPRHLDLVGITLDMVEYFPYFLAFACCIGTALVAGNWLDAVLARQSAKK